MMKSATTSQNLVVQAFLSMVLSAMAGAATAVAQYLFRGGHVDIGTALSIGVGAFITIFSLALKAYWPSNARIVIQATQDSEQQLAAQVQEFEKRLNAQPDVQAALAQQQAQTQDTVQKAVQQAVSQLPTPQPQIIVVPQQPVQVTTTQPAPTASVAPVELPSVPQSVPIALPESANGPVVQSIVNPLADFLQPTPTGTALTDDTQPMSASKRP